MSEKIRTFLPDDCHEEAKRRFKRTKALQFRTMPCQEVGDNSANFREKS